MHGLAHGVLGKADLGAVLALLQDEAGHGSVGGKPAVLRQQLHGAEPPAPGHALDAVAVLRGPDIEVLAEAVGGDGRREIGDALGLAGAPDIGLGGHEAVERNGLFGGHGDGLPFWLMGGFRPRPEPLPVGETGEGRGQAESMRVVRAQRARPLSRESEPRPRRLRLGERGAEPLGFPVGRGSAHTRSRRGSDHEKREGSLPAWAETACRLRALRA